MAAAAILPEGRRGEIPGLADSKLLTPAARERVYEQVVAKALAWSVMIIPPTEVDARGLHVCNLAAMRRALASLTVRPEYVLTDGFPVDGLGAPGLAVWKGDRVAACVAAASVLAKVTRDRLMVELHDKFPAYGFAVHKGYITDDHTAALREHGPCAEHRFSYVNVAAASGRVNRPPRARRPVERAAATLFDQSDDFDSAVTEPLLLPEAAEGTVGVASGGQPQPPVSVGEDKAMEGETR
ncbi:ribonuclease HII [Actinoplanes sp. OR16]|nr:ribonuclease HII [Actinoplanes sp. OR16]